jgi:hypothetical protein
MRILTLLHAKLVADDPLAERQNLHAKPTSNKENLQYEFHEQWCPKAEGNI